MVVACAANSSPASSSPTAPAISNPATPTPPRATPSVSPSVSPPVAPLYLALGDSLTAGYQNAHGDDKVHAYPALIADSRARDGTPWELVNLACSGETTTSMLEGGRCFPSPNSQLAQAESQLHARTGSVALVTVWIGANDVLHCVGAGVPDRACLARGHDTYAVTLPTILGRLRAAAGPQVPILVLTYYDAFRVSVAGHTPDAAFRSASAAAVDDLDAVLGSAAAAVGAAVVDTRGAIEGADGQDLCRRTLVCELGDIHLSTEGQAGVQTRVLEALGVRPTP